MPDISDKVDKEEISDSSHSIDFDPLDGVKPKTAPEMAGLMSDAIKSYNEWFEKEGKYVDQEYARDAASLSGMDVEDPEGEYTVNMNDLV